MNSTIFVMVRTNRQGRIYYYPKCPLSAELVMMTKALSLTSKDVRLLRTLGVIVIEFPFVEEEIFKTPELARRYGFARKSARARAQRFRNARKPKKLKNPVGRPKLELTDEQKAKRKEIARKKDAKRKRAERKLLKLREKVLENAENVSNVKKIIETVLKSTENS